MTQAACTETEKVIPGQPRDPSGAFDRLLFSYPSSFVSVPLRSFLCAVGSLSQRNVSALKHVEANLTNSPEPGDKASLCKPRLSTLLSVT
ncbi:unnamed protein product [Arctogadus glacialis]